MAPIGFFLHPRPATDGTTSDLPGRFFIFGHFRTSAAPGFFITGHSGTFWDIVRTPCSIPNARASVSPAGTSHIPPKPATPTSFPPEPAARPRRAPLLPSPPALRGWTHERAARGRGHADSRA